MGTTLEELQNQLVEIVEMVEIIIFSPARHCQVRVDFKGATSALLLISASLPLLLPAIKTHVKPLNPRKYPAKS